MKSSKSDTSTEVGDVAVIPEATMASFLNGMHEFLLNVASADSEIALTEHLDRKQLDFGVDSLREIDRYLNCVNQSIQDLPGLPLLSTIWTIALYIGEVIRRGAPARRYQWVSVGDSSGNTGETTIAYTDFGAVRALRAKDGTMCMPSRAVLKVILRGLRARSIQSFSCGAMSLTDSVSKPGPARPRAP